jgi:hypothetical protein
MEEKLKETLIKNFDNYIELLDNNEFEKSLVKELNERIDIPVINEKTEKKVIKAIYRAVLGAIKKIDTTKL